jgi:thiamine transporter ThiT
MNDWLKLALSPMVRNRAFKVALVVGCIIGLINYGDRMIMGTISAIDIVKILLTFLVPYSVSTYSAVGALQEAARKQ